MKTLDRKRDSRELVERLRALDAGAESHWGRMTVTRMLRHLADGYRMGLREHPAEPIPTVLPKILRRWIGLWTPFRWPRGLPAPPSLKPGDPDESLADFESERDALMAVMTRFSRAPSDHDWPAHPSLGGMSRREWMRWGWRHADHHLRQFGV